MNRAPHPQSAPAAPEIAHLSPMEFSRHEGLRDACPRRIAAIAAIFLFSALSAPVLASAAFDEASIPMGDVTAQDGIVTGTVRIQGGRFVFYNGSRIQSLKGNLEVNFMRGGSLLLCPHSQVQVLSANQNTGMMLAFQEGGSQQSFPIHPHDVVMTPDWRVEMAGDAQAGDTGVLQLSTSRRGDLCLTANTQPGVYFKVTQLAGEATFNVPDQKSVRFSDGTMANAGSGCSCGDDPESTQAEMPALPPPRDSGMHDVDPTAPAVAPPQTLVYPPSQAEAQPATTPARPRKQRPQDLAGFVGGFIHKLFGR